MKLSKELEKELRQVYLEYWDCYMRGDSGKISRFLDSSIKMMGTTESEVFNNKKEALKFFKTTAGEVAGKIEMRNRMIDIVPLQDLVLINEQSDLYVLSNRKWVFYSKVRLSSLLQQQKTGWKFIQQHGSMPDTRTGEGETIAFERITKENLELRDAVNRRTVELENKSRALEIESSLERARTVAMGMKVPEDMLDVCRVISKELQGLGIKEIRNVQTAIIDEGKASYLNYEYFRLHRKSFITAVEFKKQKDVNAFVKKMLKDPEGFFTKTFKGAELKDWMKYQAKTGQFVDPQLKKVNSLHYYFYSIGPGALGISAYAPLAKEGISLFKQFRNVFLLAYRRFLDIQKAEAQAREAKIELGLERVRARAMAMQESDELAELVATVFNELTRLDFTLTSCIIWIHDPEPATNTLWIASAELNRAVKPYLVQPFHHDFFRSINHAWKAKDPKWVFTLTGPEKKKFEKAFYREIPNLPEALRKALSVPKEVVFSASFNNFGALEIVETEALTAEKFEILHRFGNVFNTSYTRFNDLKKAEAQAREAQIEAALERVRSRTMAMHRSEEIADIVGRIFRELQQLDLVLNRVLIWIFNDDEKFVSWWSANPEAESSAESYRIDYNEQPVFLNYLQAWQKRVPLNLYTLSGDNKKNWEDHLFSNTELSKLPIAVRKGMRGESTIFTTSTISDYGLMMVGSFAPLTVENSDIIQRFGRVFQQSYTRYLDVQKAEAQAREARIEAALEKVRSRSLAMHKTEELGEVATVVFEKLRELDVPVAEGVAIVTHIEGSKDQVEWMENPGMPSAMKFFQPYYEHPILTDYWKAKNEGLDFIAPKYTAEQCRSFFNHIFEHTDYKYTPQEIKDYCLAAESYSYFAAFQKNSSIFINDYSGRTLNDQEIDVIKRFSKVFEQAYVRFLDLQKAEAQAKEAQIEAALERVRSRTMAMHKSVELLQVITILSEQLQQLSFKFDNVSFAVKNQDHDYKFWLSAAGLPHPYHIHVPYLRNPMFDRIRDIQKGDLSLYSDILTVGESRQWHQHVFENSPLQSLPAVTKDYILNSGYARTVAFMPTIMLVIGNYASRPYTEEENNVFRRFASVFEQSYTRFLDMQKAEAQARESQIELGLERVRARAMAMQKSDELKELIGTVSVELTKLDVELDRCFIAIFEPESKNSTWWMASPETPSNPRGLGMKYHEMPPYLAYLAAWKERKLKWQYVLEGVVKKSWDSFIFSETEFSCLPDFIIANMRANEKVFLNASFNSFGCLTLATLAPLSEENFDILLRFAKVFDLTYTRFNDLQKAEAQAREAKIEAALERVRSRAMAMHKSEDLSQAVATVFEELDKLDLGTLRCGIGIINKEKRIANYWVTSVSDKERYVQMAGDETMDSHPLLQGAFDAWIKQEDFSYDLKGEDLARYYKAMVDSNFPLPESQFILTGDNISEQYYHLACFEAGGLFAFRDTPFPEEARLVMKRFARVFNLTYKRFLDLQKAEAQARESQIQLALERVRARTMAMHHSDELTEVVKLLYQEFDKLKISNESTDIEIGLIDEETGIASIWAHFYLSDGSISTFKFPFTLFTEINNEFQLWKATPVEKRNELFLTTEFSGDQWERIMRIAVDLPELAEIFRPLIEAKIEKWVTHNAYFSHGLLTLQGTEAYSPETQEIQKRFAKVFEQTHTRFLDLQKAEAQAREAQIELGLERVRARALAMHSSEELGEMVAILFEELVKLELKLARCIIWVFDNETFAARLWMANSEDKKIADSYYIQRLQHPYYEAIVQGWKERSEKWLYELKGEDKKSIDKILLTETELSRLPEVVKNGILGSPQTFVSGSFYNFGFIEASGPVPHSDEQFDILNRFGKVFDLSYTRFNDLQKAEAQAREAQIEASLERLRSKTMAMHNSQDVGNTVATLFDQLVHLGVTTNRCGIIIFSNTNKTEVWTAKSNPSGEAALIIGHLDVAIHPLLKGARDAWNNKETFYSYELAGEDIDNYYSAINNEPDYPTRFNMDHLPSREIHSEFFFPEGAVFAFTSGPVTEEARLIFKRFAGVFGQTYRRYLDLQRAEAQAREAQIEAGLERVRSRTMGMRRSDELQEAALLLFQQVMILEVPAFACGFNIWDEDRKFATAWMAGQDRLQPPFKTSSSDDVFLRIYESSLRGESLFVEIQEGDMLKAHYAYMNSLPVFKEIRENMATVGQSVPTFQIVHCAFFSHGYLMFISYEPVPYAYEIFKRFAKVFEQTYTRFLDLQKAEAQAREARIEAALERVRAKTMAMQNSSELADTSFLMANQIRELGIRAWGCAFHIYADNEKGDYEWFSREQGYLPFYKTPRENFFKRYYEKRQGGETLYIEEFKGEACTAHYEYLMKLPVVGDALRSLRDSNVPLPSSQIDHVAYFSYGYLLFITYEPVPEAYNIFKRFAKEFEQTYTRFLDLQKAEVQAREAQIEVGLERVRARTMAMQKSDELPAAAKVMFEEFRNLQYDEELKKMSRGFITTINEEKKMFDLWVTDIGGNEIKQQFKIDFDEPTTGKLIYKAWKNKQAYLVNDLQGDRLTQWLDYLSSVNFKVDPALYGTRRVNNFLYYSNGFVGVTSSSTISEDSLQILLRFAKVFEQTFTRFLDLQKAEASTREAVKQAALDRIRADIASMRTVEDLEKITPLMWNELTILGIPFIRCGVFIMDESQQLIHTFLSSPDGKAIAAFHLPYNTPGNLSLVVNNWQHKKIYIDHWDEEEFVQFADILAEQEALGSREQYLKTIPKGGFYLHFLPFLQGMLYVGNTTQLDDEDIKLLQSVADAFSTAYARYEDFNKLEAAKQQVDKTLTDLKQTQQQLVQSEKMASLGELTAGIAHEIQNPLNFVNNFAQVSAELLAEMTEEVDMGNFKEVKQIADDVRLNLEKIDYHGKRADAIVKGMLQHSRSSSGLKESTDINILADEYLRLAYHGLRAKDKSFNVKFETNFDNKLEKINVVRQDIGRVILNLINNAFYTVNEKAKQHIAGYEPIVTVDTKKLNGKIEISVKDNGNGIPDSIKEKIFQPFFTTKSTGQGTGLGLSLSYDIVKAHGGEIFAESKDGEGTTFMILLPII